MTDTTQTPAAESERKRKTVSKRDFLDAAGAVVDKIEDATGARYTVLAPSGNIDLDIQFGDDIPAAARMCAIFGFHTKMGNVANTVLNDKEEPGTPEDAAAECREFMALLESGKWAERTATVGARTDKAVLAAVYCDWAAKQGQERDPLEVEQKLSDNPALIRQLNAIADIKAEYVRRVGGKAADPASVLAKL